MLPLGPGEARLGGRGEMEGLPPSRLCRGLAPWLELDQPLRVTGPGRWSALNKLPCVLAEPLLRPRVCGSCSGPHLPPAQVQGPQWSEACFLTEAGGRLRLHKPPWRRWLGSGGRAPVLCGSPTRGRALEVPPRSLGATVWVVWTTAPCSHLTRRPGHAVPSLSALGGGHYSQQDSECPSQLRVHRAGPPWGRPGITKLMSCH